MGRYGSPLAYARLLDLAESHGFREPKGAKVFDFGYGSIGHLQMLARCGAYATAVDVDPILPKLYKNASGALEPGAFNCFTVDFLLKRRWSKKLERDMTWSFQRTL